MRTQDNKEQGIGIGWKRNLCLGLHILLLLAILTGCGKAAKETAEETEPAVMETARVLQENLQTILITVTDAYDISNTSGSYRNGNRADFLLLLVVDETAGKVSTLQLNPDTVIPFSIPGQAEPVEIPLGQTYSYGSGGSDSYLNLSKAVSHILDGVPVNHYLSFTMDAIGIVSDVLEGVSRTDAVDPVILQGSDAVTFFRIREVEDISNEVHMERQRQFMMGMYQPFMISAQDADFLTSFTLQLGERMATDMTLSQLLPLFESLASYEMEETVLTISGEAERINAEYRFHMDPDSLDKTLDILVTK